jgi:hypothetical protein
MAPESMSMCEMEKHAGLNAIEIQMRARAEVFCFLLLFLLSGCAHFGFPTYYDPTTYKTLTDLKPEVGMLYNTFKGPGDPKAIDAVRLKLAQTYEYEKGKGAQNAETTEQIEIISEMFEDHVRDRVKNGQWSEAHLENQKALIAKAFDIAIKTERLKNKNE